MLEIATLLVVLILSVRLRHLSVRLRHAEELISRYIDIACTQNESIGHLIGATSKNTESIEILVGLALVRSKMEKYNGILVTNVIDREGQEGLPEEEEERVHQQG